MVSQGGNRVQPRGGPAPESGYEDLENPAAGANQGPWGYHRAVALSVFGGLPCPPGGPDAARLSLEGGQAPRPAQAFFAPESNMITSLLLLAPVLAPPPQIQAPPGAGAARGHLPYPDQAVVRLQPGVDPASLEAHGVTLSGLTPQGNALYAFPEGTSAQARQALVGALAGDPSTGWAEPNLRLGAPESGQCSSAGISQSCTVAFFDGSPLPERYHDQPAVAAIDVEAVWNLVPGGSTVVAVIDTGVDPQHSVLQGRLADVGWDFVEDRPWAIDVANGADDDGDGLVDEAFGHGTHVAGTINLINPHALILPLRVLDSDGNGNAWDVATAIRYAVDAGAEFINLSLGMTGHSQAVSEALDHAYHSGVAVFASAGNTGRREILFPGRHDDTFAVAATDLDDLIAPFSAYGHRVDLCAPGVEIYGPMPGEQYAWWSGTSMATAVATGAGSLVHLLVSMPASESSELLEDGATEIDLLNPGLEEWLGEGRVDVLQAAIEALDS